MRLEDVDWRAGELLIRGKGSRYDVLPLPVDVGEALVSYLRRRPRCESRALFVRMTAPLQELAPHTIGWIVREACTRAGLPRVGAHRLRHTAATEMLRQGASLAEISQVLRHREQKTTAIYAKVDRRGARGARAAVAVAGRWCSMSPLRDALAGDYLRLRRRLGFEMPQDGRLLEGFVDFLEQAGAERITTKLALEWALRRAHTRTGPSAWGSCAASPATSRRSIPRARFPPRTSCPAIGRGSRHTSIAEHEIAALIAAAGRLRPPLRALRHQTLIGLLAVTGLRAGEALALDRHDVDLRHGVVHVSRPASSTNSVRFRCTPPRSTRCASTRAATVVFPEPSTPAFFIGARGRRVPRGQLNRTFTELIREVGLDGHGARATTATTRSPPLPCRAHAGRLVPGRRGHRPPAAAALHVSRSCRSVQLVWYLEAVPRVARADQPPAGATCREVLP